MEAPILRRAALVLLASIAVACSGEPGSDAAAEAWPLELQTDGVLAYAALRLPARAQVGLDELFGVPIEGVAFDRHLLALHLDTRVFGGAAGFALPITDADAFRRSVESSPFVASLGGEQYRLQLPAEHPVARMVRVSGAAFGTLTGGMQITSLDQIGALLNSGPLDLPMRLRTENGHALLAPSLEGAVVTRRVLQEVGGLDDASAPALVAALSVERVKDTYYAEIQQALANLRSALLGAKLAGLGGALSGALNSATSRGNGPLADLPIPPAAIWAFLELIGPQRVDAVGMRVASFPGDDAPAPSTIEAATAQVTDALAKLDVEFSLRYADDAPERRVIDAYLPAPELPDALLVYHVDAGLATEALAHWLRPLAVLAHGDGTVADAWQQEFVSLSAPWDGRVIVRSLPNDEAALFLGTHPDADWDLPATEAWLRPLAQALEFELPGADAWRSAASGARVGDFTVIASDVLDDAQLDALARELDEADWTGEDLSQPALRVDLPYSGAGGSEAHAQLSFARDPESGDLRFRFVPAAAR